MRAGLLLLVLFALLPSFVLLGYSAVHQHREAVERAERETLTLVRSVTHEHLQRLSTTRLTLQALAQLPALRAPGRECEQLLGGLLDAHPFFTNIAVADRAGDIYCSALPMPQAVNITDRRYFTRALETRAFSAGEYQVGRITQRAAVNYGYPLLDAQGEVTRVLFAAMDLDWMQDAARRADLPSGSVLLMTDAAGRMLARFPDPPQWPTGAAPSPVSAAMLALPEGGSLVAPGIDGVERLYGYAPFTHGDADEAFLAAGIPLDAALTEARSGLVRNVYWLALVTALALIATWMGGNVFVLRRVKALGSAARRLAHGDLEARSGLVHGEDELGRLASAFDDMASSLQRVDRALRTLSAGNRALVRAVDEAGLLREICRIVVEAGGYRCAWVCYLEADEPAPTLRLVASHGLDPETASGAQTVPQCAPTLGAVQSAAPLVLKEYQQGTRPAAMPAGCHALAFFPLRVDERAVGALVIGTEDPDSFDTEALSLLEETAGDLSYGIGNLRARLERQQAQEVIQRMVYYDTLTTLPNHAMLERRMRSLLKDAREGLRLAMLIVDLERFREINEALGFHQGDALLKAVGARLRDALPKDALVARLRGDEFAVLLSDRDAQAAIVVARRIREALDAPFTISGLSLRINAVIGIALAPEHSTDPAALARHAEVAARQAKRARRGYALYDAAEDADGPQRLALASDLRRAIDEGGLMLHYQPQIDLATGAWCGCEALVRWQDGERGNVPPDVFIPLAEHTGLIKPLTFWVLEEALCQAARWRTQGIELPVAVNLSAWNLRDSELHGKVRALLTRCGAQPGWLELEITESAMMEDPGGALLTLKALSELGVALSIDDFGTGYSSLSYLAKLPVHSVKIDKSFVKDMLSNPDSAAIVRSTIGLAHDLNLKVVAEGVEDAPTGERLARWGCDVAQGYYYGAPMPAPTLQPRLTRA